MNCFEAKIFGIGLPRTGTTSLHLAFQQLGIASVHFPFTLWEQHDYSLLDKYEAFCDGPIYAMYPELSDRCPDSVFILTTRPLDDWLESMEWLLKHGPNIWGWSPAYDRFHAEFFGNANFDRTLYTAAYNCHHEKVYRWTEQHQAKLLVLDTAKEYGFAELCEFLNLPILQLPYPKSNPARTPSLSLKCVERAGQIYPPLGTLGRRILSRVGRTRLGRLLLNE